MNPGSSKIEMIKQFIIFTCSILIVILIIAGSYVHVTSNSSSNTIATNIYKKVSKSRFVIYSKDSNNRILSINSAISLVADYLVSDCQMIINADHFTVSDGTNEKNAKLYSQLGNVCFFRVPGMKKPESIHKSMSRGPTARIEPNILKQTYQEKPTELPKQTTDQSDVSTQHDIITCPSVEKVQQESQQINNPLLYDGTYRITTSVPVFKENNIYWIVGVTDIVADSSDEAIEIARTTASKANHKKNEYAEVLSGPINIYICNYGPGDVGATGFEWGVKKLGV